MIYIVIAALLRIKTSAYLGNYSQLTHVGKSLFNLSALPQSILLSFGSPPQFSGRYVPTGLTLQSRFPTSLPTAFQFESPIADTKFFAFSPKISMSPLLIEELTSLNFTNFNVFPYSWVNLSLINVSSLILEVNSFDNESSNKYVPLPFVYRSITGDFSGISHLTIKTTVPISIFESLPEFCIVDEQSIESDCDNAKFSHASCGSRISISSQNCSFSYRFRCNSLHWSKYPQNPDRGFFLGPPIVSSPLGTSFGNSLSLVLPTPDFSMVYNTPIIIGCFLSSVFAYIVRKVSQK